MSQNINYENLYNNFLELQNKFLNLVNKDAIIDINYELKNDDDTTAVIQNVTNRLIELLEKELLKFTDKPIIFINGSLRMLDYDLEEKLLNLGYRLVFLTLPDKDMIVGQLKDYYRSRLSIGSEGDVVLKKPATNTKLDNFHNSPIAILFDRFNIKSKYLSTIINSLPTSYSFKECNVNNLIYAFDYPTNLGNHQIQYDIVHFLYKRSNNDLHNYLIYLASYLKLSGICFGQDAIL